jgi:hypothetical protein
MKTLDLSRLVQTLRQVEPDGNGDLNQRNIDPYLIEHVIIPFLCCIDVRLDELDYSMFTTDDITVAIREIDNVSYYAQNAGAFMKGFRSIAPTTSRLKAFC